jgi:hypothetical protein
MSRAHPLARPIAPANPGAATAPQVDPLAHDLAVAELHDAHDVKGLLVVVPDDVLVDPQVVAADGPLTNSDCRRPSGACGPSGRSATRRSRSPTVEAFSAACWRRSS